MRTCCDGRDGRRSLSFCETVSNGENGMKRALLSVGRAMTSGTIMNDKMRMLYLFPVRLLYNMMASGESLSIILYSTNQLRFRSFWKTCDVRLTDQVISLLFKISCE